MIINACVCVYTSSSLLAPHSYRLKLSAPSAYQAIAPHSCQSKAPYSYRSKLRRHKIHGVLTGPSKGQ